MNNFLISLNHLKYNFQNSISNILMMVISFMLVTIIFISTHQINNKLKNDSKNIDGVIGAKGSALQIALSTIWHVDIPTGNIKYNNFDKFKYHPAIKKAVPIALGDNFKGFRIIGTNKDFLKLYQAEIEVGKIWDKKMQIIIGANIAKKFNLAINDNIYSSHGIHHSTHMHENEYFTITGILTESNSIIDNLLITNIENIWDLHQEDHSKHKHHDHKNHKKDHSKHEHDDHKNHKTDHSKHEHDDHKNHKTVHTKHKDHKKDRSKHKHHDHKDHKKDDSKHKYDNHEEGNNEKEITAILLQFKNKAQTMGFGHEINNNSNLQFSAPNFEMVKLFKLIGLGSNGIKYFTIMIISLAFIMLYLALINSVEQRKYDIAIFRSLGSSKQNIFSLIMIESFLIVFIGSFFGLILGQLLIEIISEFYFQSQEFGIKGFIFIPKLYLLWILFILTSQIIAILPAIKAYKIQIKNILTYA